MSRVTSHCLSRSDTVFFGVYWEYMSVDRCCVINHLPHKQSIIKFIKKLVTFKDVGRVCNVASLSSSGAPCQKTFAQLTL